MNIETQIPEGYILSQPADLPIPQGWIICPLIGYNKPINGYLYIMKSSKANNCFEAYDRAMQASVLSL